MNTTAFDLNDAEHEPSDQQLQELMESVAAEVRRRAAVSRTLFMENLRAEILRVNAGASIKATTE
jgi:hypothetical protein